MARLYSIQFTERNYIQTLTIKFIPSKYNNKVIISQKHNQTKPNKTREYETKLF